LADAVLNGKEQNLQDRLLFGLSKRESEGNVEEQV